jgi:transposase
VQWALIEPLVPVLSTRGERPPKSHRRRMVDAILHVIRTTVFREELPQDFPPWATVLHLLPPLARRWSQDRSHARAVRRSRSVKCAIRPPQPGLQVCARCGDGQGDVARL